jgi:hypothetical protein
MPPRNWCPSIGSAFGGSWLSYESIEDYLVLHRMRANVPVHVTFSAKVGKSGLSPKSAPRPALKGRRAETRSVSNLLTTALSST